MSSMRILCLLPLLFADGLRLQKPEMSSAVELAEPETAKPVFYIIVMGKLAYRHQVSMWLSSLRKLGGYKDEVVLVTDKPNCLAQTLTEAKLLGEKIQSDESADIYGPAEGYVGNIHLLKRPKVGRVYEMKMEKMRAWTNIQNAGIPHPVSSIIYADEDIVIGKDLTSFIEKVREGENTKHIMAVFKDTGRSYGELHTGVVALYPGPNTEACLAQWGKNLYKISQKRIRNGLSALETGNEENEDWGEDSDGKWSEDSDFMGPDQRALARSAPCRPSADSDGIKILPEEQFWFPTLSGMKKQQSAEFIHFTNRGRWKTIPHSEIRKYLTDLGIPEHIDPLGETSKTCKDA